MISSSSTESSCSDESEYDDANDDDSVRTYENPNYRKLYAALNMTAMMGEKEQMVEKKDNGGDGEDGERQEPEGSEEEGTKSSCSELPCGWERHEDDKGPYYWHIPSGTIQRDKPKTNEERRDSLIYLKEEDEQKSGETKGKKVNVPTFVVHSLGWMQFDEQQITPATSSKAIQKCIMELTTRGDNNAVRCWGKDTQQLLLKIEECHIKLYDMNAHALLASQSISGIRVWGVNDNNDFAYVAKDTANSPSACPASASGSVSPPSSASHSPYKCHVFHCEDEGDAAQEIATILKDEMIQMKLKSEEWQYSCASNGSSPSRSQSRQQRPKHLFIYDSNTPSTLSTPTAIEFPTPIEEPRKTLIAKYLGKITVAKPMGIDVLNEALQNIVLSGNQSDDSSEEVSESTSLVDRSNIIVLVHVSPSVIILESNSTGRTILECRVRYLSFLGISNYNVKNCGFIMQVGERQFEAHCFECEPSAGALCKTIEAACKLRYQKCLDAHQEKINAQGNESSLLNSQSKIKSTIRSVFSKFLK